MNRLVVFLFALTFLSPAMAQDARLSEHALKTFEIFMTMDAVEANAEDWERPPFKLTSDATNFYAHGLNERVPIKAFYDALDHWSIIIHELAGR